MPNKHPGPSQIGSNKINCFKAYAWNKPKDLRKEFTGPDAPMDAVRKARQWKNEAKE